MFTLAQTISLDLVTGNINRHCPVQITNSALLTKAQFSPRSVVFYIDVDEQDFDLSQINSNSEYWKKLLISQYEQSSEETQQMLAIIASHDASLSIVCKGTETGNTAECVISPSELTSILEINSDENMESSRLLEGSVIVINNSCPIPLYDGVVLSDISIQGYNLLLNFNVDESIHNMDEYIRHSGGVRRFLIGAMRSNEGLKILATMCLNCDKGVLFHFQGVNSGKFADIAISTEQIKEALER
jgi:hypothetical protein